MLYHAVGTNDFELVKLLVSRGANVNAGDFPAINYVESKEMLEYLLSQGANIRQLNIYGQPPGFDWAHKNPALWREFVAHGADAVPRDSKGQTNAQYWQAAQQEQYQKTLEHNAQIERDNERNRQANENMARQAQSVTRELELRESIARASQSSNNSSASNTQESTLDRMNKAYSAQQGRDAASAAKEKEHRCSASNMSSDSRSGC
ncbi:MAG: hypothetical protein HXX19_12155 [Rhodoferax sp.]|nr:hypothetical protein [Rhodoferax sp.]